MLEITRLEIMRLKKVANGKRKEVVLPPCDGVRRAFIDVRHSLSGPLVHGLVSRCNPPLLQAPETQLLDYHLPVHFAPAPPQVLHTRHFVNRPCPTHGRTASCEPAGKGHRTAINTQSISAQRHLERRYRGGSSIG